MLTEEVHFWYIQWAGRWMITRSRRTEADVKREHPEAIKVDGSQEVQVVQGTVQEQPTSYSGEVRVA